MAATIFAQSMPNSSAASAPGPAKSIYSGDSVLQELFLRSPCPTAALQMRKDLQHWPQALSLAHQLDPSQVPGLACSYAQVSSHCQQLLTNAPQGTAQLLFPALQSQLLLCRDLPRIHIANTQGCQH